MSRHRFLLLIILIVGLAARLVYALAQDPLLPYENQGGDTHKYLANAYALVTNAPDHTEINGMETAVSSLDQPPVFFIIAGLPQVWFTPAGAIIAIRILQIVLSTAACFFAYRMAYLLVATPHRRGDPLVNRRVTRRPYPDETRGHAAGLIAAAALAFSPVFVMEAAEIKTETAYIFFVAAGVWLFLEAIAREERRGALLVLAGILLGLGTLTRAVFLLFPLALVVYLLLANVGWRRAALLLVVYALVLSTWTIYARVNWNRWIVAGAGLDSFLYIGATGWDSAQAVDQRLLATLAASQAIEPLMSVTPEAMEESPQALAGVTPEATPQPRLDYASGAQNAILSDIPGWVRRRVSELAEAYLQPYGTVFFPDASLRELALGWLRSDRSLSGLVALTRGNSFWPKLLIYVLYYGALLFGLVGMWRTRRSWRLALPLIGFIAYTTLIHLILLALPRYLFPTMVFWVVFAAAGIAGLRKRSDEYGVPSTE
jgi:4-amino-4-deoxy-L-arabinose transferase-like glycosyltransferase